MVSNGSRKIWGLANKGQFEIVALTQQLMPGALKTMRDFFLGPNFPPAFKIDSKSAEELQKLCVYTATDGVSFAAVEKSTGIVAATMFNKIHVRPKLGENSFFDNFLKNHCTYDGSKNVLRSFIEMDHVYDIFDHYKTDCYFEIFLTLTLPEFRSKKLCITLTQTSLELAEGLKSGKYKRERLVLEHEDEIVGNARTVCEIPDAVVTLLLNDMPEEQIARFKENYFSRIPKKKITNQGEMRSMKEEDGKTSATILGKRF